MNKMEKDPVKQWLEDNEKVFIDLTKERVFEEPIKCWYRNMKQEKYTEGYLIAIRNRMNIEGTPSDVFYLVIEHTHYKKLTIVSAILSNRVAADYCILINPTIFAVYNRI